MAELLIKAIDDGVFSDVAKDRRCYKKGDIVAIMPDGHEWGRKESLPKFLVVKTLVSVEDMSRLVQSEYSSLIDRKRHAVVESRRRYMFDFESILPSSQLKAVRNSSWLIVEIDRNDIVDKVFRRVG